jgi:pyrroline-5-carboxylate reductase
VNNGDIMTLFSPSSPLALFGCGNMGRAMLDGWLAAGIDPSAFVVIDPGAKDLPEGVAHFENIAGAPAPFQTVLLGIKPQMFAALKADIARAVAADGVLLSVLAGTRAATLAEALPGRGIVRLMPNLAASLGKAPIGIWTETRASLEQPLEAMLSPLGLPVWIAREEQMDIVTALAGSGPAFVYRFIDSLAKAATQLGLGEAQAATMAKAMVEGAAALAARSEDNPASLAAKVTSAGGTTAAGLSILDDGAALDQLLTKTLRAARDRGVELSGQ